MAADPTRSGASGKRRSGSGGGAAAAERDDARRLVPVEVLVDEEEQRVGLTQAVIGGGPEAAGDRPGRLLPGHHQAVHQTGQLHGRSAERRGGIEGVSTWRSRWWPYR